MRGFTTVRDNRRAGLFGLKLAIDQGAVTGPRIFPSGAMLSQTSGHGDFRLLSALPRMPNEPADYTERTGVRRHRRRPRRGAAPHARAADARREPDQDHGRRRRRLALRPPRHGAVHARRDACRGGGGGGLGHLCLRPCLHPAGILRCLEAGVRSIEHAQLADTGNDPRHGRGGCVVEHPALPRRRGREPVFRPAQHRQAAAGGRGHGCAPSRKAGPRV